MMEDKLKNLEKKFSESGERERIKKVLLEKLEAEGWVEKMKTQARQEIRHQGLQNVTVESLYDELKMPGRKAVSNDAKTEIYQLIKNWIQNELDVEV